MGSLEEEEEESMLEVLCWEALRNKQSRVNVIEGVGEDDQLTLSLDSLAFALRCSISKKRHTRREASESSITDFFYRRPCPLFVTSYTRDYKLGDICAPVNRAYCKAKGYGFHSDVQEREDMMKTIAPRTNPTWYKVVLINRLLDAYAKGKLDDFDQLSSSDRKRTDSDRGETATRFTHIVWIDADAVVVRQEMDFEDVITAGRGGNKELIVSEDLSNACRINAGVLVVKICSWSQNFWSDVWQTTKIRFFRKRYFEQSAIVAELGIRGESLVRESRDLGHGMQERTYAPGCGKGDTITRHVCVMPRGTLQSNRGLRSSGKGRKDPVPYIFHAVGGHNKLKVICEMLRQVDIAVPEAIDRITGTDWCPKRKERNARRLERLAATVASTSLSVAF